MNDKYLLVESQLLQEIQTRQIWGAIIGGTLGGLSWVVIKKVLDAKEAELKRKLKKAKDPEEKKKIRKLLHQIKLSKTEKRIVAGLSVAYMAFQGYLMAYKPDQFDPKDFSHYSS